MNEPMTPIEQAQKGRVSRKLLLWAFAALLLLAAVLIIVMTMQQPNATQAAQQKQDDERKALAKAAAGSPADIEKLALAQEARVKAENDAADSKKKYNDLLNRVNGTGGASSVAGVPAIAGTMTPDQLNQYQRARDGAEVVTDQDAKDDMRGWVASAVQAAGAPSTPGATDSGLPSVAELAARNAQAAQAQQSPALAMLAALKGASAAPGGPSGSAGDRWNDSMSSAKIPAPAYPEMAISPNTVHQGTAIPLATVRKINSDIPGTLEARVIRDVYDTIDTSRLVLPMGTRVIGPYNSDLIPGQSRLQGGFTRMIFPNGNWINLAGSQLSDRLGEGGLGGDVNYHLIRSLALQFAVAGVAKLTKIDNGGGSGGVSLYGGGSTSSTAGQILTNTMQSFNQQFMNLKATITVEPGTEFTVTLSRDLILPPAITVKRNDFSGATDANVGAGGDIEGDAR
uniref:TrbI/VirB10 family protein n=1 Tax=Burkholderia arboris TaxID=488730 RepID=UPI003BEEB083